MIFNQFAYVLFIAYHVIVQYIFSDIFYQLTHMWLFNWKTRGNGLHLLESNTVWLMGMHKSKLISVSL